MKKKQYTDMKHTVVYVDYVKAHSFRWVLAQSLMLIASGLLAPWSYITKRKIGFWVVTWALGKKSIKPIVLSK